MAGQLFERPAGSGKWQVRVYLGRDAAGKRRYHNKLIRGTKKDAQRYLTRTMRELDLGTFVEPSRQDLGAFLDEWISTAKPGIRDKTRQSYRFIINAYLKPALGALRLDKLAPSDIQRLYTTLSADKGLSARTVRYTHAILRSALQQAVKWGKLARNPADLVELPARQRREMTAFSSTQAALFLREAESDRWHALWLILVTAGLRPGEALGLKWTDFSDDGARVRIQRVLVRIDGEGWDLKEPKTDRSRRVVSLPNTTVTALREHRTAQAEERLYAGEAYENYGLVFATQNGRPLDYRAVIRRHFKPLLRRAGLPGIRPYDLRHTCATLLLTAGEHPKVVSERLGHSSIVMTLDVYSHVLPDMQQGAADKLESMLFQGAATSQRALEDITIA